MIMRKAQGDVMLQFFGLCATVLSYVTISTSARLKFFDMSWLRHKSGGGGGGGGAWTELYQPMKIKLRNVSYRKGIRKELEEKYFKQ